MNVVPPKCERRCPISITNCFKSPGLVSDYIRRQRRREAASHAIESSDEDDDQILPRTSEMERVRRAVRQRRDEEHEQHRAR